MLTYAGLYVQFQLAELVDDFVHRPYITVGIAAFAALLLMAVTSTQRWRRRLQKLATVASADLRCSTLAVVHLLWLRKDHPGWRCLSIGADRAAAGRAVFYWQQRQVRVKTVPRCTGYATMRRSNC